MVLLEIFASTPWVEKTCHSVGKYLNPYSNYSGGTAHYFLSS